jgi:hypothetical protein
MNHACLVTGALWMAAVVGAGAAEPGFEVLFDGTSTAAWRGFRRESFPDKGWAVVDGALKTVVGGDRCDLVTREAFDDFELELEWRVSPGGNSGVFYDVSEAGEQVWHTGPEMQVLDDQRHRDGQDPKTSAGSLYALLAPAGKTLRPVGEFNLARLVKRGRHVEHWLNGAKVVEYELMSPALAGLIAASKFKDMPRFAKEGRGHIALQHHGEEVAFRNIRVRRLGGAGAPGPDR